MFDEWAGVIAIVLAAALLAVAIALTAQTWKTTVEVSKALSLRVVADAVPYNGSWVLAVFNLGPPANITGVWTARGFVPIGKVLDRGGHLTLSLANQPFKVQACALPAPPLSCDLVEVAGWMIHAPEFNASTLGTAVVYITKGGCGTVQCSFVVNGIIKGSYTGSFTYGVYKFIIPVLGQSIFEAQGCAPSSGTVIDNNNFTGNYVIRPGTVLYFGIMTECLPVTVTRTETVWTTETITITAGGGGGTGTATTTPNQTTTTPTATTTPPQQCIPIAKISTNIDKKPNGDAEASVTCNATVVRDSWTIKIYYDNLAEEWYADLTYMANLSDGGTATGNLIVASACQKDTQYTTSGNPITIQCGLYRP